MRIYTYSGKDALIRVTVVRFRIFFSRVVASPPALERQRRDVSRREAIIRDMKYGVELEFQIPTSVRSLSGKIYERS